jgi:hypothetical protein
MSAGVLFGETFPPCLNVVLQWLGVSRETGYPASGRVWAGLSRPEVIAAHRVRNNAYTPNSSWAILHARSDQLKKPYMHARIHEPWPAP